MKDPEYKLCLRTADDVIVICFCSVMVIVKVSLFSPVGCWSF